MLTTDTRIEALESQVRTLRRLLLGGFALCVIGGLLAATVPSASGQDDKPMKVQLVGPITVDGVGAVVNHTVNWDGIGALPVSLRGSVDIGSIRGSVDVAPRSSYGFKILQ